MELAERTLKGILNSLNSFILKAEKEQNNGLLELLEKFIGYHGVKKFDTGPIEPLYSVELVSSWSLPIVTLTYIAVALPHIPKDKVKNLVKSIGEGLSYTHLMEESLNISSEHVNIRKVTITLCSTGIVVGNTPKDLIASNLMYRITRTILHREHGNSEPLSKKQLFALLNGMIADILSTYFTNIPQVIKMKWLESVIEKREASVRVAAKLLGKTKKILERLETLELPSMDDDKMTCIDEWRLHFYQSIL
nr:hypothetical protein CTI12_AA083380 [Tanacetum cinerariifolium]